jgi:hypothetical protein
MSIDSAPADGSPEASPAAPTVASPAPPSWPWRRAALFLVGAAQLITISALVGVDPIPATWSSLLLAVAPAPLAAAAAFASAPVNLLAAVAGIAVLAVGVVAQVTHTVLFFVPALVVLAVGAVKLWREQVSSARAGVSR